MVPGRRQKTQLQCRSGWWLLPAVLATLSGGCSSDSSGDPTLRSADGRKILRVAYNREIDVLNPYTSQNLVDIEFSMIEGLVTTNDRNTYVPVLAREIPTRANGLVTDNDDGTIDMTWRLHDNVRWHDGEPFTSGDVCFTWKFVRSDGSETYNRDWYLGIVECSTPDDQTVILKWDKVYAYYAGVFEAILPEHILGGMTTEEIVNYEPFNRGPATIGTGPFKFAEWKTGEYIRVVRNDDYWRGTQFPAIDEIVWSFIPDSNTRLNALLARRHHYGQIEPVQVPQVAGLAGYETHLVSTNSVMHFDVSFNTARSRVLFGERDVRRALFHAIDRQAIAGQLMQGTVRIANSPVNPTSPYHNEALVGVEFDPEKARDLLTAAGWVPGPDGVRVKDGQRFEFEMINRAGSADRIAVAQVIQAQLKDVGVEVSFLTLESAAWTARWRRKQWEALVSAWFLPADPSFTSLYSCDGPNNMTGQCYPELDAIMARSDEAIDFAERKTLLDEAQAALEEAAMTLPIYFNVVPEVVSRQVVNYRGSGTNFGSFWNLYEWRLEP